MKNFKKVNLGCGNHVAPGWLNIDNSPNARLSKFPRTKWLLWKIGILSDFHYHIKWPADIVIRDLTKNLPFKDESVEYIYLSHFFEHLSKNNAEG